MADWQLIEEGLKRGYSLDEVTDIIAKEEGVDPSYARERGFDSPAILRRLGYVKPEEVKPEKGFIGNVLDQAAHGVKTAYQGMLSAPGIYAGNPDAARIAGTIQAEQSHEKPKEMREAEAAFADVSKRQSDFESVYGKDSGYMDSIGKIMDMLVTTGKEIVTNPKGMAYEMASQSGNMVAPMVGAYAGGKTGAVTGALLGPKGAVAGGVVGAGAGGFAGSHVMEQSGEFRGKVAERLSELGLEPTAENVSAIFQDKAWLDKTLEETRDKATGTAVTDGVLAAIGGLAVNAPIRAAQKTARAQLGATATAKQVSDAAADILASQPKWQKVAPHLKAGAIGWGGEPISEAIGQQYGYGHVDYGDVGMEAFAAAGEGIGSVYAAAKGMRTKPTLPANVTPPPSITSASSTDDAIKAFESEVETALPAPRGSFGGMDEFAGLIENERSDIGKRRGLLAQQQQEARDMEAEFSGLVKDEQIDQSYRLNDAQKQRDAERTRDGSYDLALQQREEQQGRTVEQLAAASEAQGFGAEEPTAMQLAMQRAQQKALDNEFSGLLKQERASLNEMRANVKRVAGVPVEQISTPQLEEIAQSEAHPNTKMAAVAALNDRHDAIQQERERLMQLRETRLEKQSNQPEQGAQHGAESHGTDGQVATPSVAGGGANVSGGGFDAAMVAADRGMRETVGAGAAVSSGGQVGAVPVAEQSANVRALTENAAKRLATQLTNQGYPTVAYPHPTQAGMWAIGSQDEAKAATVPATSATQNDAPPRQSASWVIRNKETGEVVMETFDRKKVDALNTAKYEAVPIREYLEGLNNRNESTAAEPPAVEVRAPVQRKRPASNNIAQAIINLGGISTSLKQDITGDASVRSRPGLFTKNGTADLGELAARLSGEFGFTQIDVNDPEDNSGAKQLADLIARAVNGESILNEEAMIRAQQDEEFEQAKAEVNLQAQEIGIKPIRGKRTIDIVQSEINAILAEREEMSRQKKKAQLLLDEVAEQELIEAFDLAMQEYHDETAISRDESRVESARLSAEESAQGDGDSVNQASPVADRASPTEGGRGEAEVTPEFGLVGQTEEEAIAEEQARRDVGHHNLHSIHAVLLRAVESIIPDMQRFERVFGKSQWAGYAKKLINNNDVLKGFLSQTVVGDEAKFKIALAKAADSKALESIADRLRRAMPQPEAKEIGDFGEKIGAAREGQGAEVAPEFGLVGQTEAEARAEQGRLNQPEGLTKEQIDREATAPFSLHSDVMPPNEGPTGITESMFTPDGRATRQAANISDDHANIPNMDGVRAAAQQILDAIEQDDLADYGLRVIPGEFEGDIAVGDVLPPSRVWEDGRETDDELLGTSTVEVGSLTLDGVLKSLNGLGAAGKPGPNGYYFGDRVVLVKGDRVSGGDDSGESLLKNASVVGVWRKASKGLSSILPNEAVAPKESGANTLDPIAAVKATLDAAGVTGTDRTSTIAAVRRGDLTPEDVAEAHPSPNVADSASEGKPIRPYATPDERNEAIWTLQAEAKSSGLEYSNESIKDAAEFGAPANEIAAAIDAGEDAVADLAERYAKRSNGLRQGFGQGNNDNALRENMKPPSEHEKRIASLTGRGLYELTEAQRSSLLKFAKVRSIDAFEDIAFSARREIIGQWLDMNPAVDKRSSDVAMFNAKSGSIGNPIDTATLESTIASVIAASQSQWSRDTVVTATLFADLPAPIVEKAKAEGYDAHGRNSDGQKLTGATYDGKVYLVQENISSEIEAEETLLHERIHQILHGNAEDENGKALRQSLGRLYSRIGGKDAIVALAKRIGADMSGPLAALPKVAVRNRPAFLVDEFLAHVEGQRAYEKFPQSVVRAIREFYGEFRDWLRSSKFVKIAEAVGVNLDNFTQSDLSWTLKKIRQQQAGTGSKAIRFMTAWHGSPHDHDGFDSSKIGTGEGAQAYGWGHYFASSRDVAEWYRKSLTLRNPDALQMHALSRGLSPELADTMTQFYAAKRTSTFDEFASIAMEKSPSEYIEMFRNKYIRPAIADGSAKGAWDTFKEAGRLYQVELAPEPDEYLDWDKPLSEQSEKVREALIRAGVIVDGKYGDGFGATPMFPGWSTFTGESIHRRIVNREFEKQREVTAAARKRAEQAASEYLQSIGIRGIRYLDGSSRGTGEGSHNYVIFDGADAKITAKFSRSSSTKAAYESRIDALVAGERANRVGVRVLDGSDVLGLLGHPDKPVVLQESKVLAGRDNHPRMTAEAWKKVPEWLDNPAAVFDSDTVGGRLVFVAPELVDGAPALMIVEPQPSASGGTQMGVSLLVNAYDAPFMRWIGDGLTRFADQKKFPAVFAQSVGRQLPNTALHNKPGMRRILTEKNLAGWRKENATRNSAATSATGTPVATIRAAIQNAYGKLLDRLEAKGLVTLAQTIEDAVDAAAQARAKVTGERVEDVKRSLMASVKNQAVWHGTPHRGIEKTGFRLIKIGTGEGAQAYGWGVYFAGAREVAEAYRKELQFNDNEMQDAAMDAIAAADGSEAQAAKDMAHEAANIRSMVRHGSLSDSSLGRAEMLEGASQWINDGMPRKNPGQLYSANIPEDSDLLDWDKPLSEQPGKVREAIKAIKSNTPKDMLWMWDGVTPQTPGRQLYGMLGELAAEMNPEGADDLQQAASELMLEHGIPGLRYLDGNSRGNDEGTHNYVIWDEAQLTPEAAQIEPHYSKNGDIEGFFDPVSGKSFLIADALTEETAPGTLMHEVGIHMAAEKDGPMQKLIARAGKLRQKWANNKFVQEAEARMREAGETSDEEFLAYTVTQYENNRAGMPVTLVSLAKDFIAAVKAWMFNKGYLQASKLTVADLAAIARANARKMARGMEAGANAGANTRQSVAQSKEAREFAETERAYGGREAYDRAKADGKTKLNYRQWVQVRADSFKAWFGDWENDTANASKVADPETGEPLVVYHGTGADFTEFKPSESGVYGGGVYFTKHAGDASAYGKNNIAAYLSLNNPIVTTRKEAREIMARKGGTQQWAKDVRAAGYDGVYVSDEDFYIAFSPTQIKSATGNTGAFDGANPDIRFSRKKQTGGKRGLESRARIIGDSGRQYTPEQQQMFKTVGRETNDLNTVERIKKWANKNWVQGIVDQFAPIKDIDLHAYTLTRLSKGAAGAFEAFMDHGKLSLKDGVYDADTGGGVMQNVFFPLGKETTDFLYWIAGNRAERLAKEGKERLFSPEDIAASKALADGVTDFDYTLANGKTTRDRTLIYADSLKKFNEYNKNVMDMAEQSGLIDGASRHLWEHEFYVPFYRVMDESDGGVRGMNIKQGVVRQQAFKKLKGGEEGLNDLLANTLMNWAHLIDASAKNRAAKATLEAAQNLGIAQPAGYGEKKTVWYMGDVTRTIPKGQEYEDDGVTKVSNGTDKVQYHGRVEFSVSDPQLLIALQGLDYAGLRGPIMDILSKTKHMLTLGVTASPFFKIRNLIRDSVQAVGTSDLSYNIAKNLKQGAELTNHERQEYVSALAGGALIRFGTMLEGNEAARTRQLIKKGAKDEHILDNESKVRAFYDKYLEPGIAAYNELGNRGEEINRMALYDQLIKQKKSHAEASLMARDLMDFSLQGSFTTIRFLTQTVPFMNARLQGLYKLGRSAKDEPAKMAIVTGMVALASLALLAAYGDDDDWKKREDWDRNNYWWFKFGGVAFRIPKPFELGAIGTLAERSAELIFDKEMTGKRFKDVVLSVVSDQLSMNPVPQLVKPVIDIYANKDSFTGRPIESMSMEKLAPQYRYSAGTSMVARGASTAIGGALSPVQIDHLVRGYFSWLGAFAVGAADMAVRSASDEPTRPTMDYWKFATGGMVSDIDSSSSRYVSQMYEQAKELEQAYGTWHQLRKEGKIEEANEYRTDHDSELRKYRAIEGIKKAESKMNERIRMIERSNKDPEVKRELIRQIQKQKDLIARRAF